MKIFMIRSKPHKIERLPLFLEKNLIAIGWSGSGDLTGKTSAEIKGILKDAFQLDGQSLRTNLGMVNLFVNTMSEGDIVLIRDRNNNDTVHIGKIDGSYHWDDKYIDKFMAHTRSVNWLTTVPYSSLNGSIQTLLKNVLTTCKYPGTYEESGLEQFITSSHNISEENEQNNQVLDDMLSILRDLAHNAEDEKVRLDAAKELLNHLKR